MKLAFQIWIIALICISWTNAGKRGGFSIRRGGLKLRDDYFDDYEDYEMNSRSANPDPDDDEEDIEDDDEFVEGIDPESRLFRIPFGLKRKLVLLKFKKFLLAPMLFLRSTTSNDDNNQDDDNSVIPVMPVNNQNNPVPAYTMPNMGRPVYPGYGQQYVDYSVMPQYGVPNSQIIHVVEAPPMLNYPPQQLRPEAPVAISEDQSNDGGSAEKGEDSNQTSGQTVEDGNNNNSEIKPVVVYTINQPQRQRRPIQHIRRPFLRRPFKNRRKVNPFNGDY